jgi:hypothetical protein
MLHCCPSVFSIINDHFSDSMVHRATIIASLNLKGSRRVAKFDFKLSHSNTTIWCVFPQVDLFSVCSETFLFIDRLGLVSQVSMPGAWKQ